MKAKEEIKVYCTVSWVNWSGFFGAIYFMNLSNSFVCVVIKIHGFA